LWLTFIDQPIKRDSALAIRDFATVSNRRLPFPDLLVSDGVAAEVGHGLALAAIQNDALEQAHVSCVPHEVQDVELLVQLGSGYVESSEALYTAPIPAILPRFVITPAHKATTEGREEAHQE